jgi:putative acetyltransferase
MILRPETPADFEATGTLIERAFGDEPVRPGVEAIRAARPDRCFGFVAEEDGRILGHILFQPTQITGEGFALDGLGLSPLSVDPDRQNEGIGTKLGHYAMAEVRKKGFPFILVLGHPTYYPRFGFQPAHQWNISSTYGVVDPDAFMIEVSDETALAGRTGVGRYDPVFDRAVGAA